MVVIDEAAHIEPDLFYQTIVPILSIKNTALITLSSPDKSNNYFSRLANLREEHNPDETYFRIVNCFMICNECRKLEKSEQIKCNHVKQGAFWISQRKVNRLKRLYESDPATAIREFGGIIEDDYDPCFDKHDIKRVFCELPHVVTTSVPNQIIVSVDPNGGGASKMAITSGYFDGNDDFIVSFLPSNIFFVFVSQCHVLALQCLFDCMVFALVY